MQIKNLKSILLLALLSFGIVQGAQTPQQIQQAQVIALQNAVAEIQRKLTPEQQQFLADLQESEGDNIALLFINPTENPTEFAVFLKETGSTIENAKKTLADLQAKLASRGMTPEVARWFYETMSSYIQFMMMQQVQLAQTQTQATPQEMPMMPNSPEEQPSLDDLLSQMNFDPSEDESKLSEQERALRQKVKTEKRKVEIHKQISKLGNLKQVLTLDPETDLEQIKALVAQANESRTKKLSHAAVLQVRSTTLAELAKLDVKPEDIPALLKENNARTLQNLFAKPGTFDLGNTLFYDPIVDSAYFTKLVATANRNATPEEKISVEAILGWRSGHLAFLAQNGISLDEFKAYFKTEIDKKNSAANKSLGYALASSTLFGTANIFKMHNQFAQKMPNSIINWFMGTIGYKNSDNKFEFSKSGLAARGLELLALHPTTELYKESHLEDLAAQVKNQQMLNFGYEFFAQDWRVRAGLKIAPYLITGGSVLMNGDVHAQIPAETLAKHLGPIGGATASFLTSKAIPALTWMAYLRYKKPLIFAALSSFFTRDKHNVMNSGLMSAGNLGLALVKPFDAQLTQKLAPKDSVFWKTFLGQGWVSKLAEIGYKTGLTAAAYKQFNDPDHAWCNVVFGNEQTRETVKLDLNAPTNKQHKTWFETLTSRSPGEKNFLKVTDTFVDGTTRETFTRVDDSINVANQTAYHVAGSFDPKLLSPEMVAYSFEKPTWKDMKKIEKTTAIENTVPDKKNIQALLDQRFRPINKASKAAKNYASQAIANLITKGLATAGLTSLAVSKNKYFVQAGTRMSRFVLDAAVKFNLITQERHGFLITAKNGAQMLVKALFGLMLILESYQQNPSQLLLSPEALPKMLENLIEHPEKLAPATKQIQHMIHEQGAGMLYKVFVKKFIHFVAMKKGWNLFKQQDAESTTNSNVQILELTPKHHHNSAAYFQSQSALSKGKKQRIPQIVFDVADAAKTPAKNLLSGLLKFAAIMIPWALATAFVDDSEDATPQKQFEGSFDEPQPLIPAA